MNPIAKFFNKKEKEYLEELRRDESDFETYRTLAALDVTPRANKNMLQSPEAEAEAKTELARLRKKFWDDKRSPIVDRARPASLDANLDDTTTSQNYV